ncbi:MAG: META domain-containing protein [Dehalococcoidaceae bacterium]|nr:META domain-containing protein [Dehalococcoidaceae bacterium]
MKRLNIWLMLSLAVPALITAGGCAGSTPATGLENTAWELEAYGNASGPAFLIPGTRITLTFDPDLTSGSGSAGCNSYGAHVLVEGSKITFSEIYQTEMYCLDPAGIMDQENSYLELLGAAKTYSLGTDNLTIYCDNAQVLVFNPAAG